MFKMVWKNTTHFGCGTTLVPRCANTFLVCLYKPKGNVEGHALMDNTNFEALKASGLEIKRCDR